MQHIPQQTREAGRWRGDAVRAALPALILVLILPLVAPVVPQAASAQSLLDRPPNLSGGWVGGPQTLHFNVVHRFNHSGAPQRQISSRPTFLLAYAPAGRLLAGASYATRSDVAERMPNEWEVFTRFGLLSEQHGQPADVSAQVAYNVAAESVDGELSIARRAGPVRLIGAGRVLSSGPGDETRFALAGGATLRVTRWVALAADGGTLLERRDAERAAWGVGVHFGIPLTPHTLSIQATNTNSATLHGASRGGEDVRWGFEFTVPVALRRYFGRRAPPPPATAAPTVNEDSLRRQALIDSVRAAMAVEFARVRHADSLRFALRDDSLRLAQQLDSIRREARQDSIRRAGEATAQRTAAEAAARAAQRERASREPVRASMRNLAYVPDRIEVDVGTTIIWRNDDQVEHTVTATDRTWDSGLMRPGDTWQRTFDRPGRYEFFCTPHPFMTGVVIVRERQ